MTPNYRALYYFFAGVFIFNSYILVELFGWRYARGAGGWGLDVMLLAAGLATLAMLGLAVASLLAGGKARRENGHRPQARP